MPKRKHLEKRGSGRHNGPRKRKGHNGEHIENADSTGLRRTRPQVELEKHGELEDCAIPAAQVLAATFGSNELVDSGDIKKTDALAWGHPGSRLDDDQSSSSVVMESIGTFDFMDAEVAELDIESGDAAAADLTEELHDPFIQHFEATLTETEAESAKQRVGLGETVQSWLNLRSIELKLPFTKTESIREPEENYLSKSHVRSVLVKNLKALHDSWTTRSNEVFSILNNYLDFHVFDKHHEVDFDMKRAYCLHVLNHILKTRNRIISHNSKITRFNKDVTDYRDQSFTRPKVLVLVPFRHHAYKIFEILSDLLNAKEDIQVMNRKRFIEEFGWHDKDPITNSDKPEDFRSTFIGNTDDCFRIGVGVAKKTLKLYTEFYSSDILIASPLGLRMIIGNEGEKQHEYDFLSSIEILILDQADVFLMQNWEHVTHIMKHLHRQPKTARNVDFSRVRPWVLNGWNQIYRQTIVLSSFRAPELQGLISRSCSNFAGSVCATVSVSNPLLSSVVVSMPHSFHRIVGNDFRIISDARFSHFCEKILPQLQDTSKSQTMIFIPSYFDFVRIRNHFKREDISFVQICEYSASSKIARARDLFFHGKKHFLLYTERFHFYRRYRIRGIRHILFYDLPHYSQFYPELCNMMVGGEETALHQFTSNVLYSKYDSFKLTPIIGTKEVTGMMQADKSVHMFVTTPSEL